MICVDLPPLSTPLHRIGSLQQVIQSALEAKDHQWSPVLQSTAQRIGDTLQGDPKPYLPCAAFLHFTY